MSSALPSVLVAALFLAGPAAASAQAVPLAPPTPEPRTEHYGQYIVLVDAAAVGLTLFSGNADSDTGIGLGVGLYLTGGPLVHLRHGQGGKAIGSLALRVVLPVAGAMIGENAEDCAPDEFLCGLAGAALGGLAGMGTAMLLDWTVLGHRTVEEPPAAYRHGTFTAMPDIAVSPEGDVRLGLLGTF